MAVDLVAEPVCARPSAILRRLDWDTEFFDALMGTIDITAEGHNRSASELTEDLNELVIDARAQGYRHLVVRAQSDDTRLTWAAEAAGFGLVDVGVDLRVPLDGRHDAPALPVRPWEKQDLPALRSIASESFVYSRFAIDPFFSQDEVAAFHETWITNLCQGLAREVLVTGDSGQPTGFVSCAINGDSGRIPLIAVHESGRRSGTGRALVSAALECFSSAGCREAWVKTQAHNFAALALYQRCGFAISRVELAFSITLGSSRRG